MSKKTIGILQPGYLPWLGFFEQMYKSDVFIIYDDVKYDKGGWRNRNRIKSAKGIEWLTIPVHVSLTNQPLILDVLIDNKINWRKKHLFSIKQNYSKSFFFSEYISIFEEAYSLEWKYLIDIDMFFILKLKDCLGMNNKEIIRSSSLNINDNNTIDRLVKICKLFDADIFYEGSSGRNYINDSHFLNNGIKVQYQDYKHPIYKQFYGDFIPYLSVVDLLLNCGKESLSIILNNKN